MEVSKRLLTDFWAVEPTFAESFLVLVLAPTSITPQITVMVSISNWKYVALD
jgi:hypothetical protein